MTWGNLGAVLGSELGDLEQLGTEDTAKKPYKSLKIPGNRMSPKLNKTYGFHRFLKISYDLDQLGSPGLKEHTEVDRDRRNAQGP